MNYSTSGIELAHSFGAASMYATDCWSCGCTAATVAADAADAIELKTLEKKNKIALKRD